MQGLGSSITHVLIDEGAHACLHDAAALSGLPVIRFRSRNPVALHCEIKRLGRRARVVVLSEGLSPYSGAIAPVREYLQGLPDTGWLVVDDAHGAGVLGARGRGTLEALNVLDPRIILTLTLSKAFGAYGGAVLGPNPVVEQIATGSRIYLGNTPLPLPLAAAALEAVRLLRDRPMLRRRLTENIRHLKRVLEPIRHASATHPGPMFALEPGNVSHPAEFQRALRKAGHYSSPIRYPGGPASGYFRFAVSSEHTARQIEGLGTVLRKFIGT
jgi:7-keto-8-aminopelargonate synthetase-like enzyme